MRTPAFTTADVRRYYDRNTSIFSRFGRGGEAGAIHRAVWGPGAVDRDGAFRFVEDRIAEQVAGVPGPDRALHVVDLGCGVGASLCYLAQRFPIRATGITLSPVQARLARDRIAAAGLSARVVCVEGDYCELPPGLGEADLAYAIESFVHGPSPERFFAEAARLVRPGGVLIVCDDVRRETTDPRAARTIARFTRGWHVNSLLDAARLRSLATAAGFAHVSTSDLTPYLGLHRLTDRVIDGVATLVGWWPGLSVRLAAVVGGGALHTCLAEGWIGYELAIFRRSG